MWIFDKIDVNTNVLGIPYYREQSQGHSYENLRENPSAIDQLPEPQKAAALYDFIKEINSSASAFQSFGCEKWEQPWTHPQFPDFTFRSGSYVDIAFADVNLCRTQDRIWKLIDNYRTYGQECIPHPGVHVGFEVRATGSLDLGGWWTLEFWNYGMGRTENEANYWWAEGIRCFKGFLLDQSVERPATGG
jgi:hypothetical protein